ncbi:hypothetical protein [Lentibacter sp. XHP0401]|uniref:hypothetical protein n=1 Tax=Lentibacter sp. XHP0401 TaxID=2984334 RepID=UPI0021E85E80|nr:hypothetical protein [Lentibacter sp. XHP0401]MCV2892906.1 hypothetical protein [Lentibacter sp. XHP0401]
MSFIRPEAEKFLNKYKEVLVATFAFLLGAYWAAFSFGLLPWLGYIVMAASGLLLFSFLQRAWFARGEGGRGFVEVDEGQISYFAPESGGMIAVRELTELTYDARPNPPVWTLRQAGLPELVIPANAKGAPQLFDAFAALPGLSADRLLTAQRGAKDHARVIWRKDALTRIDSPRPRLHS